MSNKFINFLYDPQRQGYDTNLWKTLSGSDPAVASSKLVMISNAIIHYGDMFRGLISFLITVPVAPVAGQGKSFGLTFLAKGTYAKFIIVNDALTCETVDEAGTVKTTTVTWDASWTAAAVKFEIDARRSGCVFKIGNKRVAYHELFQPKDPMCLYIANTNADNMLVSYVEARDVESYQ